MRAKSEPMSARGCGGMNFDTPKWAPILGVGIPMDFQLLRGDCRGQNSLNWKVFYIIEKFLDYRCLKWAHMTTWIIKSQVMAKRRAKSQIVNLTFHQ
jgi:hypothetical protein